MKHDHIVQMVSIPVLGWLVVALLRLWLQLLSDSLVQLPLAAAVAARTRLEVA